MANAYTYSNLAQATTLSGSISSGTTTVTVAATTGFPGSFPYVLALDYGASTEELVLVTAAAGSNLTVTRAFGGTSAQSHSLGAVVRHVINAQDLTDFRTHEAATAAVHGISGALVGTSDTQTLANKTLTSPTVNSGVMSGTFSGAHTYSGAVTLSGGGTLTGTFTGSPTLSGSVTLSGGGSLTGTFSGSPTLSGTVNHTGAVQSTQSLSNSVSLGALVTGDGFDRYRLYASGLQEWGPGNATRDTNLYRSSANLLATDDSLSVGGGVLTLAADTNLYRLSANVLKTDDSLTVAGDLNAEGYGQQLFAWKAADSSRTSATASADPDLTVAMAASATYRVQGTVYYTTTDETNADLSLGFAVPSGATGRWTAFAQAGGSPSATAGVLRTTSQDFATFRTCDAMLSGTATLSAVVNGLITTTNSGNFAVSWARTGGSGTVTMLANSWLSAQRVD